jgi:hypothetical protein
VAGRAVDPSNDTPQEGVERISSEAAQETQFIMAGNKCHHCGTALDLSAKFCAQCGTPVVKGASGVDQPGGLGAAGNRTHPGGAAGPQIKDAVSALFRVVAADPTGILAATAVFVVAAIVCWIAWKPLSWPGRVVTMFVYPGNCVGLNPGSAAMYVCSAAVALRTLIGPLVAMALFFVLRRRVIKAVRRLTLSLPEETHFLVMPVFTSLYFALYWAPIHYHIGNASGLVSQKTFPAVMGLCAFALSRYGQMFRDKLAVKTFYDWRDKKPRFLRIGIAILFPVALSLAITFQKQVTHSVLKEQSITLITLCFGYLALAPREGSFAVGRRH